MISLLSTIVTTYPPLFNIHCAVEIPKIPEPTMTTRRGAEDEDDDMLTIQWLYDEESMNDLSLGFENERPYCCRVFLSVSATRWNEVIRDHFDVDLEEWAAGSSKSSGEEERSRPTRPGCLTFRGGGLMIHDPRGGAKSRFPPDKKQPHGRETTRHDNRHPMPRGV